MYALDDPVLHRDTGYSKLVYHWLLCRLQYSRQSYPRLQGFRRFPLIREHKTYNEQPSSCQKKLSLRSQRKIYSRTRARARLMNQTQVLDMDEKHRQRHCKSMTDSLISSRYRDSSKGAHWRGQPDTMANTSYRVKLIDPDYDYIADSPSTLVSREPGSRGVDL